MSKRARRWLLATTGFLLLAGFIPWPLAELSQADQVFATRSALSALTDPTTRVIWYEGGRRWWPNIHYESLPDAHFAAAQPWRYKNELPYAEECFVSAGMTPISPQENVASLTVNGITYVRISSRSEFENDHGTESSGCLYLTYIFGPLGGQGLKITVWRSLFLRYVFYKHLWVS